MLAIVAARHVVLPDFKTGIESWILSGGAHHTGFSTALSLKQIVDFATIFGIELVVINETTSLTDLKRDLMLYELVSRI